MSTTPAPAQGPGTDATAERAGPLAGVRVVEFGGIGPSAFAGMLLADMGADVVRVDRPDAPAGPDRVLGRGRRVVALDARDHEHLALLHALLSQADILIEGFRPGVMERLGLGPDEVLAAHPRLVYARVSGWGRAGQLASAPGHDLNFLAATGLLDLVRQPGSGPVVTPGLLGDLGGAGMALTVGLLAALARAWRDGTGQVVDTSILGGATLLTSGVRGLRADSAWARPHGENIADGGAPFYNVYGCADGRWISAGAIEPDLYESLRRVLGLTGPEWDDQYDQARWPARRRTLTELFRSRAAAEWAALPGATSACLVAVLTLDEADDEPQARAEGLLTHVDGYLAPTAGPRFSATPCAPPRTSVTWAAGDIINDWSRS